MLARRDKSAPVRASGGCQAVVAGPQIVTCYNRVSVSRQKSVILNKTMNVIYLDQYRKAKVLIAAADRYVAEGLGEFFLINELKVELVDSFEKILPALSKKGLDMVLLTSFGLIPGQIPSFVTAIKDAYPSIGVTVLSGDASIQSDVMSRGADVFMQAPFCFKELLGRIKTILAVK